MRILLLTNAICFLAAVLDSDSLPDIWSAWVEIASFSEPLILASLLALAAASEWLGRIPYYLGVVCVFLLEMLITTLLYWAGSRIFVAWIGELPRYWFFSAAMVIFLLKYFNLRARALSPALSEARLQALQARIRPHFLFNSINGVLGLIRSDPKRAETALEDMADLFRVLMQDNRQLTTIEKEVELCRQYLDLEKLRLGERLQVEWHIEKMPRDALIPPLVLQPLLENAVYHGIEPSSSPGVISINIYRSRNEVHAVLKNPYSLEGGHHTGNKMALANIRERLALHFDAEALIKTKIMGNSFQAHIVLPYLTERSE